MITLPFENRLKVWGLNKDTKITWFHLGSVKGIWCLVEHQTNKQCIARPLAFCAIVVCGMASPLCFHFLLIDQLSIICHFSKWLFVCVLFIVLMEKNQIIFPFVIERCFQAGQTMKSMNFCMPRRRRVGTMGVNKTKLIAIFCDCRSLWWNVFRKKRLHKGLRWHRDTCCVRRIWRMNHNEIDCFAMQTLIKNRTSHTQTTSNRTRSEHTHSHKS